MRASFSFLIRLLVVVVGLPILSGCTITSEGIQQYEVPIEDILPPSRCVASYRQLNKPLRLKEGELDDQIGGRERLEIMDKWSKASTVYSDYGIPERPAKARISVSEMSTKVNAYGAYSNLRPSDLSEKSYVKVGVHGTVIDDRLIFVQDRYLIVVRDLAGTPEPERRSMLINFGHALSQRLPRDITDITLVGYLPYENRVPASERLDKDDPLGMKTFKDGAVTAMYRNQEKGPRGERVTPKDARECKVFLAELRDKSAATGALKSLRKEFAKTGKADDLGFCEDGFTTTFNGVPAMIGRRESVVFGCYGSYNEKEMKGLMSQIDRRVKPYVPPKIKEKDPIDEDEKKKKKAG
ncbi:MAG: DUF6599 family protein [Planctomycetota bacterium]